jgi:GntR family transcriptional regulator
VRVPGPVDFRLDPGSGVPTYLQLVQQVEHALRLGYLKPGDQLPKVRDVVAALTMNPNGAEGVQGAGGQGPGGRQARA